MAVRVINIAPRREFDLAESASEFSTKAVLRKKLLFIFEISD